jgi:hypothetical protein
VIADPSQLDDVASPSRFKLLAVINMFLGSDELHEHCCRAIAAACSSMPDAAANAGPCSEYRRCLLERSLKFVTRHTRLDGSDAGGWAKGCQALEWLLPLAARPGHLAMACDAGMLDCCKAFLLAALRRYGACQAVVVCCSMWHAVATGRRHVVSVHVCHLCASCLRAHRHITHPAQLPLLHHTPTPTTPTPVTLLPTCRELPCPLQGHWQQLLGHPGGAGAGQLPG